MSHKDNMRGAALMAGSMVAYTLNDALIKGTSDELPLFQIILLRGILTTSFLVLLAWRMGGLRVRFSARDRWLLLLRTGAEVVSTYLFLQGLFNMPIANATAILQSLPLTVTLAGAVFLGEPVGWRRMTAILVGFLGVLLIVRPGGEGFNFYSLYVLAAVVLITARDLAARQMSAAVPSTTVAASTALGVGLLGAFGTIGQDWVPVSGASALLLVGAAFFLIGGYLASFLAMRSGDLDVVAPFRYVAILAALVLGLVFFDEWPDVLTLIGSGLVVGSGLFTLYRSRVLNAD